ncbi:hypothetical protein IQ17_03209 [Bradyrhizobium daqingense]|uniref:Uncharacterized protein n=1 Tax=Bradyrhizobium daqingense TaxID=993502 RepID=A0A562LDR8_9BRAD|nr:hypothetical protein IQ17_03209 [Bradyrhizobium daqingense]
MSEAKCAPRWGVSLSTEAVPVGRDHPTPLALRAIDPPPLQGRVRQHPLSSCTPQPPVPPPGNLILT